VKRIRYVEGSHDDQGNAVSWASSQTFDYPNGKALVILYSNEFTILIGQDKFDKEVRTKRS